ncbi:MAG: hypothetical protein RL701_4173 [Pseudomonadota bacterium]
MNGATCVGRGASAQACLQLLAALALVAVGTARVAAQVQPQAEASRAAVLSYAEPLEPNYVRAALEELGLLGLGFAQYMANHRANSSDWDYDYSWPSFRSKITGGGYRFDTNQFDTNFITHPAAGALYYWAARGNRMPLLASVAYAAAASFVWEILGEFRERASINDLLATPLSGFVLGEVTIQGGAFFDRSCASIGGAMLGSLLGPSKSLHDAIDGAHLARQTSCDRYGLTLLGAHEFHFGLAVGALTRVQGPAEPTHLRTQLMGYSRLVALDSFGQPGAGMRTFSDGNVTEWSTQLGFAGSQWNDFDLTASVIPMGLHYRALLGSDISNVRGYEVLFGFLVGTQYSLYRYDRGANPPRDRYFTLEFPGASLDYVRRAADHQLLLQLQASTTLAGIDAFAQPEYLLHASPQALTSVAAGRGYNYSAGFSLRPRARFVYRQVEFGTDLKATQVWAIRVLDRNAARHSHAPVVDVRRQLAAWLSFTPNVSSPWRISMLGVVLQRLGSIATFERSRTDLQLMATIELVL